MNILRPLSPPILKILKQWLIPLIFLATLVLFGYLVCLKMGWVYYFLVVLSKVGLLLAGRAISVLLPRSRWSGIISWGVGLALRAVVDTEATAPPGNGNLFLPAGGSGASSSTPVPRFDLNLPPAPEPASPSGPQAQEATNGTRGLGEDNSDLDRENRQLCEELRRLEEEGAERLPAAEQRIREIRETGDERLRARAAQQESLRQQISRVRNRESVLRVENEHFRNRINFNQYELDRKRFRRP